MEMLIGDSFGQFLRESQEVICVVLLLLNGQMLRTIVKLFVDDSEHEAHIFDLFRFRGKDELEGFGFVILQFFCLVFHVEWNVPLVSLLAQEEFFLLLIQLLVGLRVKVEKRISLSDVIFEHIIRLRVVPEKVVVVLFNVFQLFQVRFAPRNLVVVKNSIHFLHIRHLSVRSGSIKAARGVSQGSESFSDINN